MTLLEMKQKTLKLIEEYDKENNVLSFKGDFWNEDSFDETTATAEVVNKNGEVVASSVGVKPKAAILALLEM